MPKKDQGASLIEAEKRAQTTAYLTSIGEDVEAKGDTLTDALIRQLKSRSRKRLAERLIDIALHSDHERTALEAIREIYDRVEGKARISVTNSRAETDPLMKILAEVMANEPKLIASGTNNIIDGESRVLSVDE